MLYFRRAVVAASVFIALGPLSALAAILTVDTNLDVVNAGDGVLSLREALADSLAGDEIQFDASLNGLSIVLGGSELFVGKDLTITGPGADLLAIDANLQSRVIRVNTAVNLMMSGLTITGGGPSLSGAGIVSFGNLTIVDSVVRDNDGTSSSGGGINSSGTLVITRCAITDNLGEGIRVQSGMATITDSTISGSTATGIVSASGGAPINIFGSTLTNNSGAVGGAINNSSLSVPITLTDCTVSGNVATNFGGGIRTGGGLLTLIHTTVTNNTATNSGGGISAGLSCCGGGDDVVLHNSIVAGNTAPSDADCSLTGSGGQYVTDDFNLLGSSTGCPVGASDLTTSDISTVLLPLADNFGPTETHALLATSAAVDTANPAGCTAFDQRGLPRQAACDIGAFEQLCGDGTVHVNEECDDSNTADGDCCSSACTFDAPGAACADGDVCNGDETCDGSGTCDSGVVLDCDDGDLCTQDSCDALAGCANAAEPATGCDGTWAKALLLVKENVPGKEKFLVKMVKGPAITQADLGDPLLPGGTAYGVCVYDSAGALAGRFDVDQAGETCAGKDCWKSIGKDPPDGKGFTYKDKDTTSDGIKILKMKGGDSGKTVILAKGANNASKGQNNLPLGIALGLQAATSATVQLIGGPECYEVTVSDIKKQELDFFKAK